MTSPSFPLRIGGGGSYLVVKFFPYPNQKGRQYTDVELFSYESVNNLLAPEFQAVELSVSGKLNDCRHIPVWGPL
jgi:hypothetical protein